MCIRSGRDVRSYLLWLGEVGRHRTGYSKLTGYDDVDDSTLIGDKCVCGRGDGHALCEWLCVYMCVCVCVCRGKTQNDPFITKKVRWTEGGHRPQTCSEITSISLSVCLSRVCVCVCPPTVRQGMLR